MKILLVYHGIVGTYGQLFASRLRDRGLDVIEFKEETYFSKVTDASVQGYLQKAQRYLQIGPCIRKLNTDLLKCAKEERPDFALIIRNNTIWAKTIDAISSNGITIMGFNNDSPFSSFYPNYYWRHLRNSIRYYNHYFAFRKTDMEHYLNCGCKSVSLLRACYDKNSVYPIDPEGYTAKRFLWDISFTGHWENDGREDLIESLMSCEDIKLGLFGTLWQKAKNYSYLKSKLGEIQPRLWAEYNNVLNYSKIALVFLSKINNDSYTRRCLEIPAAGAFMLCEYTQEMTTLFKEGTEAEYFRSKDELLDKARFYSKNDKIRNRIASAGRARLLRDGHEVEDRVLEILRIFDDAKRKEQTKTQCVG